MSGLLRKKRIKTKQYKKLLRKETNKTLSTGLEDRIKKFFIKNVIEFDEFYINGFPGDQFKRKPYGIVEFVHKRWKEESRK